MEQEALQALALEEELTALVQTLAQNKDKLKTLRVQHQEATR